MMQVGDRIGAYRVTRSLGQGGTGRTCEGVHELLDEKACLKEALPTTPRELLLREAKILWGLHHPFLPTLRDVVEEPREKTLVIAMRFVEGTSLDALGKLSPEETFPIFGRMIRALRVLHHRGIVHGDVKPANVIVEPDRHGAVLVDLGMASVRPGYHTRPVGWTTKFAAPETLDGRPPLPESDLYSLGLSLVHVLGGDPEKRELPRAPEALLDWIVALTRKDPAKRPRWETDDPMASFDRIARKIAGEDAYSTER